MKYLFSCLKLKLDKFNFYIFNIIIISLTTPFLSVSGADEMTDQSHFKSLDKAQNDFYRTLKKIKNPTPQQIDQIRKNTIESAKKDTIQKIKKDEQAQREKDKKKLQEEDAAQMKALSKQIDEDKNIRNETDRKKVKDTLTQASKGDLKGLPLKETPPTKEVLNQPTPSTEDKKSETILDGSNIPKELSFPGTQGAPKPAKTLKK